MSNWLRRWHRQQHKFRLSLRDGYIHRLLGERVFDRNLWRMNLQSVAGGVFLGLFVACTPTMPFHMLLCTIGALALRVNLPAALVCCWLTNPVTAVPVYLAELRLGRHLLENSHLAEQVVRLFRFDASVGSILEKGIFLWAGALIFSCIAAVAGNLIIRAAWGLWGILKPVDSSRG